MSRNLAVVTATMNPARAAEWIASWRARARDPIDLFVVLTTAGDRARDRPADDVYRGATMLWHDGAGVVPAFAAGVASALDSGADLICCLHDDVMMEADEWDDRVKRHFAAVQVCGMAGFGGATALGAAQIYRDAYDPHHLVRGGFRSNLREAEVHGWRDATTARVACLDGFSQIGRREFFEPAWSWLARSGIVHHVYDAALACLAKRWGWEVWYLPLACHHHGGLTAVAEPRYHAWATHQRAQGDLTFWAEAHRIVYDEFRDVLPLRV